MVFLGKLKRTLDEKSHEKIKTLFLRLKDLFGIYRIFYGRISEIFRINGNFLFRNQKFLINFFSFKGYFKINGNFGDFSGNYWTSVGDFFRKIYPLLQQS